MSYDMNGPSGQREEYGPWGSEAYGASSITHQIIGPKGCVGFVRDIMVEQTVSGVGSTTVPEIMLGISSGDFTYGRYRLGTAIGTAYGVGMHRAGAEQHVVNVNNAGRQLADFAGHVLLDGVAYTSSGIAGGSWSTVVPAGRIPKSMVIVGVTNGGGVTFIRDPIDPLLKTGQLVQVKGVGGSTGGPTTVQAITAISTTNNTITVAGTTWAGTYTGGGIVNIVVLLTEAAGSGGSPAGTGQVRAQIDWHGGDQM